VKVIEPTWSWPKTTMPINLGEDMPQQPSLLHQPFSRKREILVASSGVPATPLTT
jgi:hypothetical protein